MAAPPLKALTAVDLAAAALSQQTALARDGGARLEKAISARVALEAVHAKAETDYATALQLSGAKRADDALADAAGRASVRLAHAKGDLARSVEAHAQAAADIEASAARLAGAERAHELAKILAALGDGSHEAELGEHGRAAADAVVKVRASMLAIQKRLAADTVQVARARELGAPADLRPPDGIVAAGAFAAGLHEAGGALANGENPSALRWVFQPPTGVVRPTEFATEAAVSATNAGLSVLLQAERYARLGVKNAGASLAQVGAVWGRHRSHPTAAAELDALRRADGQVRAASDQREHEARLVRLRKPSSQDGINAAHRRASGVPPRRGDAVAFDNSTDDELVDDGARV
jgi:hypothetical protein